jgi:hypothetical protein
MSVRADDLSGLDVDEDVSLAAFPRLDLDHVDVLAALSLNLEGGHLPGDSLSPFPCLRSMVSHRSYYRFINEVPTILMISIVILWPRRAVDRNSRPWPRSNGPDN